MARFSMLSVLALGCTFPGDPVIYDLDGDGYLLGADCDDRNPEVFPTAPEQCNGVDDDCDFEVDEGLTLTTYRDADLDGYGDPKVVLEQCEILRGWTEFADDCDDTNGRVHPGAPEECDLVDNDCNDEVDEGLLLSAHYQDGDRDGFGDDASVLTGCTVPPGRVTTGGDCDDTNSGISPTVVEICDTIDQNCNGFADEGLTRAKYIDGDGDTWGNTDALVQACDGAVGFADRPGDCDDSDPAALPGGDEVCDGNDDDCDGEVDEDLTTTYFLDADGDGFGSDIALAACSQPPSYVLDSTDCDDLEAVRFPGATEACDYIDNDCDSVIDENIDDRWFADLDGDGLGDPWAVINTCTPPANFVQVTGDCDDSDDTIPPNCPPTLFGTWSGTGGDERRSGHAPGTVGIGQLSFLWELSVDGAPDSAAIANGRVFVSAGAAGDVDTALIALDLTTGAELWRVDAPSIDWMSGPTWVDGLVCVTRADLGGGNVSCFDEEDGTPQWVSTIVSSTSQYMAPLAFDGRLYSGAGLSGNLYAHSLSTGNETFNTLVSSPAGWGAAGYSGNVYVWEGTPNQLHQINAGTGSDTVTTVGIPYASFLTGAGNTVVIAEDGTGFLTGTTSFAAYTLSTRTLKFTTTVTLNSFPATTGGEVYVITSAGTASAYSAASNAFLRSYSGATGLVGPPVVTDDALIVASASTTTVFDRLTGALLDQISDGGSLAVGENHLVLADSAGNVRGYTW